VPMIRTHSPVHRYHRTRMIASSIQGNVSSSRIRLPVLAADPQLHDRLRISELLTRVCGLEIRQRAASRCNDSYTSRVERSTNTTRWRHGRALKG